MQFATHKSRISAIKNQKENSIFNRFYRRQPWYPGSAKLNASRVQMFFGVVTGGNDKSRSGRLRYEESSLIWIFPRTSGSVANAENRWFLKDSASFFTKFFMVRKCSIVVAVMTSRNSFVFSGHCANSCKINFFCSLGNRSLRIINWCRRWAICKRK